MKKNLLKRIMAGFWAATFVGVLSMTALAADSVDVNGSGRYADDTKAVVGYQDKDLFSNMKDLMPGDTVENQVSLSNNSGRAVTIYLKPYADFKSADGITAVRDKSVASADSKTFRDDILDQIEMTLKLDDKIIYEGSADGVKPKAGYETVSDENYGMNLGSFAAGSKKNMVITLKLPGPTFDNSFADKFDAVDWIFCVEGTTPSSGGGGGGGGGGGSSHSKKNVSSGQGPGSIGNDVSDKIDIVDDIPLRVLPKTGDTGITGYVFGILLAILIACGALYMKKRFRTQR